MRHRSCKAIAFLAAAVPALVEAPALGREPARSSGGMVATASAPATEVGVEVLRSGGNAADAAVAAALALAVSAPQAGNLGGGGFALVRDGASGSVTALDFREVAPERTGAFTFLDERGEVLPKRSTHGALAAGVPGSVAGLALLHERWGSRPWAALVAPAERLAREGVVVDWAMARELAEEKERLVTFPETAAIFLPGGRLLERGDVLRQGDLAQTLARLGRLGARDFYVGGIAERIVAASQAHGGAITADDLRLYRARLREPLQTTWRDLTLFGMPLPSSGGVTLMESMGILERDDLAGLGAGSARYASLLAEAWRRAFFDRARHLGDPDYVQAPVHRLLSKDYAAHLRSGIVIGRPTAAAELAVLQREPEHTTHLCTADARGNVVVLTTTINDSFGSGLVVKGAGFLLNDEMDDFALRPGAPNMYGLTGGRENAVEPGKRMLSSMAPTIVLKDGNPWLALGARGGPRIITTVMQVILDVHAHGMGIQDAVDFPRFHFQGVPDELRHERHAFSPDTADALCAMGYRLRPWESPSPMSGCQAIRFAGDGFEGAADPREAGTAAGP